MYHALRWFIGLALGIYFRRIEAFHAERVPVTGPVLFVSNHPNSLTDSFLIGSQAPRMVNFVATVQLFRFATLKWILTRCGVIPINRLKDNSKAMRSVADTFEACFKVFETGGAIGIFPEGITYEDAQLKEVKTGAARMALEIEQRHAGKLGLQLVPVGLTYSAKDLYRGDVLVNFGQPIRAAEFITGYAEQRKECIRALTAEIERRLQNLILHLPELDQARVVGGVKRLYIDRLLAGSHAVQEPISQGAEELLLTQRLATAVESVFRTEPLRAAGFAAKLSLYERWLKRLHLSDGLGNGKAGWQVQAAERPPGFKKRKLLARSLAWSVLAIALAPVALFGWLHRLIPFALVKLAVHRFTEPGKRKAQTSTAAIAMGVPAFGLFYGLCILMVHRWLGWPISLWYGLSLPVTGLIAHYYMRELGRLAVSIRNLIFLLRAPAAARRLAACREELIAEIEAVIEERTSISMSQRNP